MRLFLKELFGIYWAGFDGYRPLLSAWRAGQDGGLPAAGRMFVGECRRYWPQSILSLLALVTLASAILALGLILGGVAWLLVR